jgi:hypothetical protein
MTYYSRGWSGPAFGVGANVAVAEFRASDVHGRPVDPGAETPTARAERVRQLQDARDARGYAEGPPSASPAAVLGQLFAISPDTRLSAFAAHLAEHPDLMPRMVVEAPGREPAGDTLIRMRR